MIQEGRGRVRKACDLTIPQAHACDESARSLAPATQTEARAGSRRGMQVAATPRAAALQTNTQHLIVNTPTKRSPLRTLGAVACVLGGGGGVEAAAVATRSCKRTPTSTRNTNSTPLDRSRLEPDSEEACFGPPRLPQAWGKRGPRVWVRSLHPSWAAAAAGGGGGGGGARRRYRCTLPRCVAAADSERVLPAPLSGHHVDDHQRASVHHRATEGPQRPREVQKVTRARAGGWI